MKNILTFILVITASTAFSQHTIFPKKGLAIQCNIKKVKNDTIYYYPEANNELNKLPLKKVLHYSFNESDVPEIINENDTNNSKFAHEEIDSVKLFISEWDHLNTAGQSLKSSVYYRLAAAGLAIVASYTLATSIGSNNYAAPVFFGLAALGCSITSVVKTYNSGANIVEAARIGRQKQIKIN
jgi:hypothetical protein